MTNTPAENEALAYLQSARREETRRYVLGTFDLEKAPRISPVARAIFLALKAGPLPWNVAIARGHQESDILLKTVDTWVRQACDVGVFIRTGEYKSYYNKKLRKRVVTDTRTLELGPNAGSVTW